MIRSWRFAVQVFSGVLCVALCILWVRSYWWVDQFSGPVSNPLSYCGITSVQGQSTFEVRDDRDYRKSLGTNWRWRGFPLADWEKALRSPVPYFPAGKPGPFLSFTLRVPLVTGNKIVVPYWIPILLSGSVVALPWMKRRYAPAQCRLLGS